MNDSAWRADIEQIRVELPRLHPDFFAAGNQGEFYTRIERLKQGLGDMDAYAKVLELARIVATAKDAHTALALPQQSRLPFDCYPFSEGLYITATDKVNAALLHTKILGINGTGTADILRAITAITPHENMIPLQILTLSVQLDPVDFLFYPLAEKNVEYGAFTKRFLA
jgi:hypothetical protein